MRKYEAIVIGASAGALEALTAVLPSLPADYPLPIMAVVHLPAGHESILANLLQAKCRVTVREAHDKEPIERGTVYIAPPDYHLQIEAGGRLSLSNEEPFLFSRPAIDVLFETAADAYGEKVIGIILTGANSDGARGLKAITDAGGVGIVQRPDTATAPDMPRAALKASPQAEALTLEQIAEFIRKAPIS